MKKSFLLNIIFNLKKNPAILTTQKLDMTDKHRNKQWKYENLELQSVKALMCSTSLLN